MASPPLLDRVYSVLPSKTPYRVLDVTDAEDHIRDLSARICAQPDKNSALVAAYRADQDALLERRTYLQMITPRMEKKTRG
ncbi:MAG: hypothetical protein JWO67_3814 [Streptosporangiaceae bacterium]|nr:hypothetical protein [Streptosporangiaceae bacterium]